MHPLTVPFASCLLFTALASAAGSGGVNAPEHSGKPYVILISIDGLGRIARERAATPALDKLAAEGVAARSMQPAWPTLTFPNHYAIATRTGSSATRIRTANGRPGTRCKTVKPCRTRAGMPASRCG